ncbi:class I SAM-dependent methyltransferase [Anoxynatronum sibiricum]|uniref:Class I SAM-dependent methyltransferase n=1 Tax=Anoxynatronum sibiricum TaxID=210623 RepID=A0ABU9VUW5_9CLOT
MKCRHCGIELKRTFIDLGFAPPSNAYLTEDDLVSPELSFPLKLKVCDNCRLVQTEDYAEADQLFNHDYAYFSSVSGMWLEHAASFAIAIIDELKLTQENFIIEIASNDGYLLQNFVARKIPCLGIEPTASTAEAAEALGIPVLRRFFGQTLAEELRNEGRQADLLIGNNVFAHVPDINDFVAGLKIALKPSGTITLEFPHLMRLIEHAQFDTIYHEHYSYLSLGTTMRILNSGDLRIFHVEELPTHGGSLRIHACHSNDLRPTMENVRMLLDIEERFGLSDHKIYADFQHRAETIKNDLLLFLLHQKRSGRKIAAYGAAAKGNTLLNYAGIKPDMIPYVCDAAPSKQGKYLPGSHIPILHPDELRKRKPDTVLVLPWNIADEIVEQHGYIREWGGEFYVAVPSVQKIGGGAE